MVRWFLFRLCSVDEQHRDCAEVVAGEWRLPDTARNCNGEAGNHNILQSLHIETAKALVVTIPDLAAAEAIIREARSQRPTLLILARARFSSEVPRLHQAGATQVIYEEMEAAAEMARTLEQRMKEKVGKAE